jgi:exopolysaccharide biosynthesis protein
MGFVVREGVQAEFRVDEFTWVPYPRSIVAQDRSGRTLLFLVVDGKQPGYSEGMTLAEAAQLLLAVGGFTGIQLDGGGSATLVRDQGQVRVVSSPANFQIPGWERSVASHIGIRARPY